VASLALDDWKRLDAICDRFEAACHASEEDGNAAPELSAFLDEVTGPARARLFRDLLALDLEYRTDRGDVPTASDYRDRFPEFAAEIEVAFTPTRGSDLRVNINGSQADAPTRAGSATRRSVPADTLPQVLLAAGYELLEELGRGGMGVVYRAKHVPLNRLVALKLIRPDRFASRAESARFQNEAEAVAKLDHPRIVTIYEVGRLSGLDYFSMRLIEGTSLAERLDAYAGDFQASARLLGQVAEAVHHAHQRGILHRDLKPANILLDTEGEPHVADFGLAKAITRGVDVEQTHSGGLVGTPSYMSPEQASGSSSALTTATDVHGLGAILYAMLTSAAPFVGSSLAETLDRVRGEAPAPPSTINPRVPRDLEVICLKCLEKDPARRYESAQALADDLKRWRNGEPILARPVGWLTRSRMWCRRHPLPSSLAALFGLAVVSGLAAFTWKWSEAAHERAIKERVGVWLLDPLLKRSSSSSLDWLDVRLGNEFENEPEVEAETREKLGDAYEALGQYAKAEMHFRTAVSLRARLHGKRDRRTLHASNRLAMVLDASGRSSEAESLARSNGKFATQTLGPADPITLDASDALGMILLRDGKIAEAEKTLRATLAMRRRVLEAGHEDTLRSVNHLGLLLQGQGKLDEANTLALEYENGVRCLWGTMSPETITALANLGQLRRNQGKTAEADAYDQRALDAAIRILGPDHPRTIEARKKLGKASDRPS
jgi:serine/threonine-protein kinase